MLFKQDETTKAIKSAIKNGVRMFDTAAFYVLSILLISQQRNEKEVGNAIKECISEGLVKREELFITTKLWFTDCVPERVKDAFNRSLARLGLDYVDLFMVL